MQHILFDINNTTYESEYNITSFRFTVIAEMTQSNISNDSRVLNAITNTGSFISNFDGATFLVSNKLAIEKNYNPTINPKTETQFILDAANYNFRAEGMEAESIKIQLINPTANTLVLCEIEKI